jgi:hypothetical protein
MQRREFIASGLVAPFLPMFLRRPKNFGLIKSPGTYAQKVKKPYFCQWNRQIKGSGQGKVIMLHKFLEKVTGTPVTPRNQLIGDCVGQAYASGVDVLTATQIEMGGKGEKWVARASAEAIYGGSRIECGPGKDEFYDPMRREYSDGSCGEFAALFIRQYGVLLEKEYPGFDLTGYSKERSTEWGIEGVPDSLEPLAREHPVKTVALIQTWDELIDALANGYPVPLASSLGFGDPPWGEQYWQRDAQGFMRRTRRDPWYHCMLIIGYDDASDRKGACVLNSWGGLFRGPTQHDQPPTCSFWIDKRDIEEGLKMEDSYALSCYVGYPRMIIPDARFF